MCLRLAKDLGWFGESRRVSGRLREVAVLREMGKVARGLSEVTFLFWVIVVPGEICECVCVCEVFSLRVTRPIADGAVPLGSNSTIYLHHLDHLLIHLFCLFFC